MFRAFRSLFRNTLSIVGAALATVGAVMFVIVFVADLFGYHSNPYIGIIFFLVLPSIFLFGLVLVPIGIWIEHRRRASGRAPSDLHWPRIDLNNARHRGIAFAVLTLTIVNAVIVSVATYKGVEYMDSISFCGQVCHEVMQPEFVAYQD